MDHELAEREQAVDRYLLDEFTPEERLEFEEHLFDCPICANQIRRDAISVDNLKEVLREGEQQAAESRRSVKPPSRGWLEWLRPATLAPAFAALILAVTVGYQNFVSIPALEQPQVLSSFVIPPLARDGGPAITVDRRLPRFNLNFEVDSPHAYPQYECDFQKDSGETVLVLSSGPREVASFTLDFLLPAKRFPAGHYIMILRAASDPQAEIHRYPFAIQDEESGQ